MAIAGLSHDHVIWLRNWRRKDLELVGFWEPNGALAARYAQQYAFPVNLIYDDLDAMLDTVQPEAVCAFGPIYDHLRVVEACAPRTIHVMSVYSVGTAAARCDTGGSNDPSDQRRYHPSL